PFLTRLFAGAQRKIVFLSPNETIAIAAQPLQPIATVRGQAANHVAADEQIWVPVALELLAAAAERADRVLVGIEDVGLRMTTDLDSEHVQRVGGQYVA